MDVMDNCIHRNMQMWGVQHATPTNYTIMHLDLFCYDTDAIPVLSHMQLQKKT